MKITGPNPLKPAGAARSRATGGSGFAGFLSEAEESAGPSGAGASFAPASVSGLYALQMVEDATTGQSRGRARAEEMLEELEQLRRAILLGQVPASALQRLGQLVAERRETVSDPQLAGILDEIDLRAQVELAKLEMARRR